MSFEEQLKPFDVVVVPFPFTDNAQQKRRPALVLSSTFFNNEISHSVMAMITSADNPAWPLDVPLSNLTAAGLPAPSMVRMKLFTLDHRFAIRLAGSLAEPDRNKVRQALRQLFDLR